MNAIRLFTGILLLIIIGACEPPPGERKPQKEEKEEKKKDKIEQKEVYREEVLEPEPKADNNTHTHDRPVSELIERYESEERDNYQKPQKLLGYLGDLKGKKIMDLGAGSGYFSVKLADRGAQVIAADVNKEFQNHIRKRIKNEGYEGKIKTRLIPYDSPALADGEVDMVLLVNTYHHIKDRVDYFEQVRKGLTADGELVVVDFFKVKLPVGPTIDQKVSMDEVIQELKKAGFSDLEAEVGLLSYQYIIRAQ